jgi:hypothetical protein
MMKPILLVSAFALAAPALAQTTTAGSAGQADAATATPDQATTGSATAVTTGQVADDGSNSPDRMGTSPAEGSGTTAQGVASTMTDQTDAHAGHSGTATATTDQAGTTSTAQTETTGAMDQSGATATGQVSATASDSQAATGATSGALAAGTTGTGATSAGFTGVGGPTGDLIDVAQEMLGDAGRVQQVMSGRDGGMKASDLLNQAMLTLIQSAGNTRR